ncbi:MAG: hypothetical protein G01um101416_1213 [Microgenomates group bacterium Gr01-1014_16]|nr:MAG: hypothetical protein G01um101416_1213 [Microgenomates group bacterium Gr01-1014_16]
MLTNDLKAVYLTNKQVHPAFMRNLLKERLQFYVLQFISISPWSKSLIFKGGTCLRFFFDLPRLSEDLDFDVLNDPHFNLVSFTEEISKHFVSTLQVRKFSTKIAGNGRTLYLKFPILDEIGLMLSPVESNILFVRLDFSPTIGHSFAIELSTKSTLNFSFIIQRYALPELMSGKIAAILKREKIEGITKQPRVKGRDYYDLIWYLEKNIRPNWIYFAELTGLGQPAAIKQLKKKFAHIDPRVLRDDLTPFFPDPQFVDSFSQNINKLFVSQVFKLVEKGRRVKGE